MASYSVTQQKNNIILCDAILLLEHRDVHDDNLAFLQDDDVEFDASLDEEVGTNIMMKYFELVIR